MRKFNVHRVLVAGVVTVALAGCAKTNLTNLWKNDVGMAPLGSVLVVALDKSEDVRRTWEEALSAEFQANGVNARPSYTYFPTGLPDSQQVVVVARRDNLEGVVVTHRLTTTATGKFDSDYAENAPAGSNNYWRGWYHTHYVAAQNQERLGDDPDDMRFQIDLADAAGRGTLLWTGSTTPIDPTDEEKVQVEVCGQLVSELIRQKLVEKRE